MGFGTKLKNLGSRVGTKIDSWGKPLIKDSPEEYGDSPAEKAWIESQTALKQKRIDDSIAADKRKTQEALDLVNAYGAGDARFLSGQAAHEAGRQIISSNLSGRDKSPEAKKNLNVAQVLIKGAPEIEEEVKEDKAYLAADKQWEAKLQHIRNLAEKEEDIEERKAAYASVQPQKPVEFTPNAFRSKLDKDANLTGEDSYQHVLELTAETRALKDEGLTEQAFKKMLESSDEMEKQYAMELLEEMPDPLQKAFQAKDLSLTELQKVLRISAGITPRELYDETPEGPIRATSIYAASRVLELQKRLQDGRDVSPDELRRALAASNRASSEDIAWNKEHIVDKEVEFWKNLAAQADLSIDRGKLVPNSIELDPKNGSLKEQLPKLLGDRNVDLNLQINQEQFDEYWKTLDPPELKPGFLAVDRNTDLTHGLIKDIANLGFEVTNYNTGDKEFTMTFKKKAP